MERVARFTRTSRGVRVRVSAAAGDGVLLAVTRGNADTAGLKAPVATVVSTTADRANVDHDGVLTVESDQAGTFRTVLSDGRRVTAVIRAVPGAVAPEDWTLAVTSYTAGPTIAETSRTPLDPVTLQTGPDGTLPDWQHIAGLGSTSGESTYTTTIDVPARVAGSRGGARLDLGTVLGTFRVSVNGVEQPTVDLLDGSSVDLGKLRAGENTIEVHVATLLGNVRYNGTRPYGLVGPVIVTP